jgi:hypothetical protein
MPGVLEGPDLAEEVARLEGLPVDWKMLDSNDKHAYQNGELTLIRDPADWYPYNPNAEQEARIEAEGPTRSSRQIPTLDEDESASLDLDL